MPSVERSVFITVTLFVLATVAPSQESAPASRASASRGLLAFTRGGNVWVIDADGRNERHLTRDLQYDRPLLWSPDGRRIIYWKHPEDWHLWSVDVGSGEHKNLTPDGGDCRSAAVSPDSKLIAFMSGRDGFSLMNADGSNRRPLSKLGHRDAPPAWSPDGSRLAFVHLYSAGENAVELDIYLATKEGADAAPFVKAAEDPSWSSDGRVLYCIARRKARPDLFAIDVATRTEKNLTSTPDHNESAFEVSPDGKRIALITWDADWKSTELRVMNADGRGQKTLMKLEGRPVGPSWSPDSKKIAVTSGPDPKPNVFVIDAASGESTQLTRDGATWVAWQR